MVPLPAFIAFPPIEGPTAVLLLLLIAAGVGLGAHAVLFRVVRLRAREDEAAVARAFDRHGRRPIRLLLPLAVVSAAAPAGIPEAVVRIFGILLAVTVAWTAVAMSRVVRDALLERFRIDVADNLEARKVHTQLELVRKVVVVIVVVLTAALVLMSFEAFRAVGTGLLASAGLAGIILGFAAQKTLANVLAGLQIAITQPIRIDDVLVVEGEWGRVEEITLTYVVLRIWDLRRLILPISYFIEKPFQNWTRTSAAVLGTVFVHVDYTVPVDAVRAELSRILEASPHWDGEVCVLHVTDARERTVELRALMSARDSGTAWSLRCEVREKLLDYLRREHPGGLPRIRAEVRSGSESGFDGGGGSVSAGEA